MSAMVKKTIVLDAGRRAALALLAGALLLLLFILLVRAPLWAETGAKAAPPLIRSDLPRILAALRKRLTEEEVSFVKHSFASPAAGDPAGDRDELNTLLEDFRKRFKNSRQLPRIMDSMVDPDHPKLRVPPLLVDGTERGDRASPVPGKGGAGTAPPPVRIFFQAQRSARDDFFLRLIDLSRYIPWRWGFQVKEAPGGAGERFFNVWMEFTEAVGRGG